MLGSMRARFGGVSGNGTDAGSVSLEGSRFRLDGLDGGEEIELGSSLGSDVGVFGSSSSLWSTCSSFVYSSVKGEYTRS